MSENDIATSAPSVGRAIEVVDMVRTDVINEAKNNRHGRHNHSRVRKGRKQYSS